MEAIVKLLWGSLRCSIASDFIPSTCCDMYRADCTTPSIACLLLWDGHDGRRKLSSQAVVEALKGMAEKNYEGVFQSLSWETMKDIRKRIVELEEKETLVVTALSIPSGKLLIASKERRARGGARSRRL